MKKLWLLVFFPTVGFCSFFTNNLSIKSDPTFSSYGVELLLPDTKFGVSFYKNEEGNTIGVHYHPFGNVHTPYLAVEYLSANQDRVGLKGVFKAPNVLLSAEVGISANIEGINSVSDLVRNGDTDYYNPGIRLSNRLAINYGLKYTF